MLQQTQVDRVTPKYRAFLKRFPTVASLARARLGDVIALWQGLGYNRRAKMLHDASRVIVHTHGGTVPQSYEELRALPGVGTYTATAIQVFAFNKPEIVIETNIRAAFIHHFFKRATKKISDQALVPYVTQALDRKNPREWYWALMDYGAHLKKTIPNPSRKSTTHAVQKPFRGSSRFLRGALIRTLAENTGGVRTFTVLGYGTREIAQQLASLSAEGLIVRSRGVYRLPR